jgi:dipeptidyl-peptidase-4
VIDMVDPRHIVCPALTDISAPQKTLASDGLASPPAEFFRVEVDNGVSLDGWMPAVHLRSITALPGDLHVREPATATAVDRWGGARMLFHRALAEAGYVVVSVDNRGTPALKGAAWRKVVYGAVGDLASREQAAAVKAIAARYPFVDRERIGIWGWSGGGSNTLHAMFRFPDVYKVGIAVAPVPDQRLYDTIYQERYMGLPQDNVEGYRLGSAINFAEGLRGNLLVIQAGDDNVHFRAPSS